MLCLFIFTVLVQIAANSCRAAGTYSPPVGKDFILTALYQHLHTLLGTTVPELLINSPAQQLAGLHFYQTFIGDLQLWADR